MGNVSLKWINTIIHAMKYCSGQWIKYRCSWSRSRWIRRHTSKWNCRRCCYTWHYGCTPWHSTNIRPHLLRTTAHHVYCLNNSNEIGRSQSNEHLSTIKQDCRFKAEGKCTSLPKQRPPTPFPSPNRGIGNKTAIGSIMLILGAIPRGLHRATANYRGYKCSL